MTKKYYENNVQYVISDLRESRAIAEGILLEIEQVTAVLLSDESVSPEESYQQVEDLLKYTEELEGWLNDILNDDYEEED